MNKDTFRGHNTTGGDLNVLKKAFAEGTPKAAFFVRENTTVYYSVKSSDMAYDPIWALFGTGWQPRAMFTNYDDQSISEQGILKLIGGETAVTKLDGEGCNGKVTGKVPRKITMGVSAQLATLYPVPGGKKQLVTDIQSESASIKADTGSIVVAGNRNVHRLYLATAFTILRKQHVGTTRDGVVAMIVDRSGNIISWGRKNPEVPCWHGETSSIMRLGGEIPEGCCVYSTLKPCHMCSSLIQQASGGKVKVFWGQDDPAEAAKNTDLDKNRTGSLLDGNKPHHASARAIVLGAKKEAMATSLDTKFKDQQRTKGGKKSTIDYVTSGSVDDLLIGAEKALVSKHKKYQDTEQEEWGNENTNAVIKYLISFLKDTLKLSPEGL
jgi:tRNA(Arg) A34 adenosine deaminase TadA